MRLSLIIPSIIVFAFLIAADPKPAVNSIDFTKVKKGNPTGKICSYLYQQASPTQGMECLNS